MSTTTAENFDLKGNWNDHKRKLKTKFPSLTEEDLSFEFGKKNEMLQNLLSKLGKTREELVTTLESL